MSKYLLPLVLLVATSGMAACAAEEDPGATRKNATDDPTQDAGNKPVNGDKPTPAAPGIAVGPSNLTRLTRAEYIASLGEILPKSVVIDPEQLPRDNRIYGTFWSNETAPIATRDIDQYSLIATDIAAKAVTNLADVVTCTAGEGDKACATRFAKEFVGRAYRRDIKPEEETEYGSIIDAALDGGSLKEAVQQVIENALQSLNFLYRVEAAPFPITAIDADALAARLSLFLWRTGPDEDLREAARSGALATADGLKEQARRLVADPRASLTIRNFHREWMGIEDLRTADRAPTAFTPAIADAMVTETQMFAEDVFRGGASTLATLLGGDYTFVNPALATFYGLTAPAGGGFGKVKTTNRRGILTQGSVMAANASDAYTQPIFRGLLIRERVLCQEIGPPSNLNTDVAQQQEDLLQGKTISDRERLDIITSKPDCAGCHASINPVGYALENFDSVGRYRAKDAAGFNIDSKVEVKPYVEPTDVDGNHADGAAFLDRLAKSETVAKCVTKQWLRYGLSRGVDGDSTSIDQAYATFKSTGYDVRELLVNLVTSDAFRHRAPPSSK